MRTIQRHLWTCIALALPVAVVACGSSNGTGGSTSSSSSSHASSSNGSTSSNSSSSGSTSSTSTSTSTSSTSTSTSTSSTSTSTSTSTSSTSTSTSTSSSSSGAAGCTTYASTLCGELNTCNPTGLKEFYGTLAGCESTIGAACSTGTAIAGTAGLNDAPGCLTAETASCAAYFELSSHPSKACSAAPGTIADGAACGYDAQCVAGDYCDLSAAAFMDPRCMLGTCTAYNTAGGTCTIESDCEGRVGLHCVDTFTAGTPPTGDGALICQAITYGGSGTACVIGTNHQCQTGFNCVSNACAPVLAVNAVCDPSTNNNCDTRIELACLPVPGSSPMSYACTAPTVVPSGAQCGIVGGVNQVCEGDTYCDSTATPTTCKTKIPLGGGCVTANATSCVYGLHCAPSTEPNPGTCQPPIAAVCM